MATLHLTGVISGGRAPFDPNSAGVAEAVTGGVLAAGAASLLSGYGHVTRNARLALGFALASFGVGLSFTVRGGDALDVAYHSTMLPVLGATFWMLRADR